MDIVVLNYNDSESVIDYVNRIISYESIEHIVIVDNKSTDNSYDKMKSVFRDHPKVDLLQTEKNGGYGFGNNRGVEFLVKNYDSEYIAITNPDVFYEEGALRECERFLYEHNDYCVAAPRMKNIKGNYEMCSWKLPSWIELAAHSSVFLSRLIPMKYEVFESCENEIEQVDCVSGAMLCINTNLFMKCNMYDEGMFLYYEETLLAIKLRKAGYKSALLCPYSYVHYHSVSISKTFKSKFSKQMLMHTSQKYLLRNYYSLNILQRIIADVIMGVSVFEMYLYDRKRAFFGTQGERADCLFIR